jgi:signal-transduction protein with cAMP-binding, CBS, and nucleotidyltransferase domain
MSMKGAPREGLRRVPRFSDLDEDELGEIAALFGERDFAPGTTIIEEGSGLYVIEAGEARFLLQGQAESTLQAGDLFGEVALIDAGRERLRPAAAA